MSDVYQAIDEVSGNDVAVKIVRSGDPEFVRRLAQEVRALENFEHPGLIQLLDTGVHGEDAYLVMEFIDGPTLAQSLQQGSPGAAATAALGMRLADALAYVHAQGIVHRDVKPSNIMLSSSGEAWLGDFGIAQLQDSTTMTALGTTLGTVVYMAPEQLDGHDVTASADVWSLGMVLLETLTGRRVYEGSPSEIVARRLAGPVPIPQDVPVAWRLLFEGMLDPRPEQRLRGAEVAALLASAPFAEPWSPSSADESVPLLLASSGDETTRMASGGIDHTTRMAGVAGAVAMTGDDTAVVRTGAPPTRRSRRKDAWWLAPSGLVALAALGVGLFFLVHSDTPPTTTTSTTTSTTTTTSTIPSSSAALATLVRDLATGQSAGNIDAASVQSISHLAEQALADNANGNTNQVVNDLQQALTTISNGVQNGTITQQESVILVHDLVVLAKSLGLSVTSTTTTQPGPGPGPGPGNGNGKGNGP